MRTIGRSRNAAPLGHNEVNDGEAGGKSLPGFPWRQRQRTRVAASSLLLTWPQSERLSAGSRPPGLNVEALAVA